MNSGEASVAAVEGERGRGWEMTSEREQGADVLGLGRPR